MSAKCDFRELLLGLRRGEKQAAEVLLQAYRPHIHRVISRKLRERRLPHLSADDLTQSVFRRLLARRSVPQLDDPAQLCRFLLKCADNLICDAERSDAARAESTPPASLDRVPARRCKADMLQILIEQEELDHVRSQCSEEDWQMIQERCAGQTWQEIGCQFECSPDMARIKVARARQRLR